MHVLPRCSVVSAFSHVFDAGCGASKMQVPAWLGCAARGLLVRRDRCLSGGSIARQAQRAQPRGLLAHGALRRLVFGPRLRALARLLFLFLELRLGPRTGRIGTHSQEITPWQTICRE